MSLLRAGKSLQAYLWRSRGGARPASWGWTVTTITAATIATICTVVRRYSGDRRVHRPVVRSRVPSPRRVGGTGIWVGGTGIRVGGTGIRVGGTGIGVGGTGIRVGGTGIRVGRTSVGVSGACVLVTGVVASGGSCCDSCSSLASGPICRLEQCRSVQLFSSEC